MYPESATAYSRDTLSCFIDFKQCQIWTACDIDEHSFRILGRLSKWAFLRLYENDTLIEISPKSGFASAASAASRALNRTMNERKDAVDDLTDFHLQLLRFPSWRFPCLTWPNIQAVKCTIRLWHSRIYWLNVCKIQIDQPGHDHEIGNILYSCQKHIIRESIITPNYSSDSAWLVMSWRT